MNRDAKITPFQSVADLVAPMSFLDFHKEFWTKTPKYFPPSVRQSQRLNTFFNLNDFAEAIFKTQIRDTRLTLTSHRNDTNSNESCEETFLRTKLRWATVPSSQELKNLCIHGATLSLKSIEEDISKLWDFRMKSLKEIASPLTINAYFSEGHSRASHGNSLNKMPLFIVQVLGSQTISLTANSSKSESSSTRVIRDIALEEGGILYIPPNQSFCSQQTTQESLQLHIGIPPRRTIEGLSLLAHHLRADSSLHETFPMILEDPSSHQAFLNAVNTARLRALDILEDPRFVDNAFSHNFETRLNKCGNLKED